MKSQIQFIFCSLMIFLSLGCGFSTEKRRPKSLEKRLEQRSVKKISEADILQSAEQLGDSVTMVAQATLMGKLVQKIQQGDYASAVSFCAENAQFITDSIGDHYSVKLKRVSLKNRNPKNVPNSLEKNLLEAYEYSLLQGAKLSTNLQFYQGDDSVLFNKPIFIANALCLNCHGQQEKMDKLANSAIQKAYPQDSAHAYEVGDFRGLWSVSMSKRQLINNIYN